MPREKGPKSSLLFVLILSASRRHFSESLAGRTIFVYIISFSSHHLRSLTFSPLFMFIVFVFVSVTLM